MHHHRDAEGVLREQAESFARAFEAEDPDRLRPLLGEGVELRLISFGGVHLRGIDAALEWARQAHESHVESRSVHTVDVISDHVAVMSGRVRYQSDGLRDAEAFWVVEFRDGLVRRVTFQPTREEADALIRESTA
jgi:hypothetical protein